MKSISSFAFLFLMMTIFSMMAYGWYQTTHAEMRTFTITNKYQRFECVNIFCIFKEPKYYIETNDQHLYIVVDAAEYDDLQVEQRYTKSITPNSYLISTTKDQRVDMDQVREEMRKIITAHPWAFVILFAIPLLMRLTYHVF